jgi:hypothetical protein
MDIIKGRTATIICTIYSYWNGETSTSTPANLNGATVKLIAKLQDSDSDASAVFTINGTVTDPLNGVCSFTIPAATTNVISQRALTVEAVAKLSDGSYVGGGIDILNIKPNVLKTLF